MVSSLQTWPEPVVRVQSLSDSGINAIPECYVKPIKDRPASSSLLLHHHHHDIIKSDADDIPVINLANLYADDPSLTKKTMNLISDACREWGFFQVINHGVSHQLMEATRSIWREFFHLPLDIKQEYANSPATYEGYGSRLGVEKGAKLDWSDYFFLHFLPVSLRDECKWPSQPSSCRELVGEYNEQVMKLCGKLMKVFSLNLGLEEDYLEKAFGGGGKLDNDIGASLRVNFYPKCPQPDLTLGISPHSDPGGITILLPDDHVSGLQVRKPHHAAWVTVKPIPNAFIVNLADQLQVISNAKYKSVEHRVVVNSTQERLSLAFFYNPRGDITIEPAKQLLLFKNINNNHDHDDDDDDDEPAAAAAAALYQPMTFNQYRTFIRLNGLHGKSQLESLQKSIPPH